jgi:NADPH:quinone reductase-like Zn-dependent oxidoreductase
MSQQTQRLDRRDAGIAPSQSFAQPLATLFVAVKEHVLLAGKVIEHRLPSHIGDCRDLVHRHMIKAPLKEKARCGTGSQYTIETVMKAVQFSEYGGSEVVHVVDVDEPHAGPGQVRIAVRAAGVNPSDWKRRDGQYREFEEVRFPSGFGVEASGVVDEVGPGLSSVSVGDAVFGFGENTMAQYAVLTHWTHKPDDLSFEVAGGLPVIVDTATRALDEVGVKSGQTLLVSGAAGGIGSAVIQLARHRGLTVIGTARMQKHDYLRELGAIPTTYGPGLAERVSDLAPGGVDAALDLAGSGIIPELIAIVGDPSHVLSVADFSAEEYGGKFSHGPPRDPERIFAEVARLCSEGLFRLRVDQTFPLDQTAEAQEVSAKGRVTGKLIISIA